MRRGREAPVPAAVQQALAAFLGDGVAGVRVIEHSAFARLHGRAIATTRRGRIYLRGSAAAFYADPWLMLHEYAHVVLQWGPGRLTVGRYALECLRRGYWRNRYEVEARAVADAHAAALGERLGLPPRGPRRGLRQPSSRSRR